MFRSFTVLQCSHQHCVHPVASDVEVVGSRTPRLQDLIGHSFQDKMGMPGIEFWSSRYIIKISGLLKTADLQGLRRDGNPDTHRTERQEVS